MRWYEIAQLILTVVTAAVASAIGVATFFLDREVKLAGAKLEELSLQMEEEESERTFNLELFRLVLDSLERRDEERQDVLVAYFEALQDSRFKERMLIWFRSRATSIVAQKEASRSLGREVDRLVMAVAGMPGGDAEAGVAADAPPPAGQRSDELEDSDPLAAFLGIEVEGVADPKGWDFDVFACDSSLRQSGDALVEVGRRVVGILGGLAEVGRVRARVVAASELRSGYYMIVDDIAAEQDKARRGQERLREVEAFELRPNAAAPSPWYVSLFLCPA